MLLRATVLRDGCCCCCCCAPLHNSACNPLAARDMPRHAVLCRRSIAAEASPRRAAAPEGPLSSLSPADEADVEPARSRLDRSARHVGYRWHVSSSTTCLTYGRKVTAPRDALRSLRARTLPGHPSLQRMKPSCAVSESRSPERFPLPGSLHTLLGGDPAPRSSLCSISADTPF